MAKSKPRLILATEFEWIKTPGCEHEEEYKRKSRLRCYPNMERISNTLGAFYFTDKY